MKDPSTVVGGYIKLLFDFLKENQNFFVCKGQVESSWLRYLFVAIFHLINDIVAVFLGIGQLAFGCFS